MVVFNGLRKYLVVFLLITFSASASLAAENDFSLESNDPSQAINQTSESSMTTSTGVNNLCLSTYVTNFGNAVTNVGRRGTADSMYECFEDTTPTTPLHIPLHKDDGKVIWSLTPSFSRITFNPIDDIRNLQVMLKYRF